MKSPGYFFFGQWAAFEELYETLVIDPVREVFAGYIMRLDDLTLLTKLVADFLKTAGGDRSCEGLGGRTNDGVEVNLLGLDEVHHSSQFPYFFMTVIHTSDEEDLEP